MNPTKPPRAERMARLREKLGKRCFAPVQTDFTRAFLTRNLRRWRRVIHRLPPFRQDNLDSPDRYAKPNR